MFDDFRVTFGECDYYTGMHINIYKHVDDTYLRVRTDSFNSYEYPIKLGSINKKLDKIWTESFIHMIWGFYQMHKQYMEINKTYNSIPGLVRL
jgi:hypothetical protein